MTARFYWRRAHPVRLPSRDTPVHRGLYTAMVHDELAKELEAALLLLEQDEKKREPA